MTGTHWLTTVGVIALSISIGCRRSPESQAAEAARNASQTAASPEQQQLWQDAAKEGATPGLERVPVLQDPVQRRLSPPASQSQPAPPQSITIPPAVQSEIRILVYPTRPFESFTGPAKVAMVDQNNERIQLDLGPRGTLTVLARAGNKPLPLTVGETVSVAYQTRQNPQVPNDVIAIRSAAGIGIAHVTQGGNGLVQAVVPLFDLTARQLDDQPGSPVQITGGPNVKPVNLTIGQVAQVGDATVRLLGSTSVGKGADIGLIEGAPFTLNVLVWKVP